MIRRIRTAGALAVVVGSMIGVGILLTPSLVARATTGPAQFLGLWALGGLIAGCGAATWAELGTRLPRAGGDVVFQRAALGPAVAVASGWVILAGGFAGSIAAMAAAVAQWQADPLLAAAGLPLWTEGPISGRQAVAVAVVALLTAVNAAGVRPAVLLQGVLTWTPAIALALAGPLAMAVGPVPSTPAPADATLGEAWLAVYFTYAGWPAIVYVAGDVARPERALPRAMVGGTVLVTGLYLLVGASLLAVWGLDGLRGLGEAGTAMATHVLGPQAALVVVALIAAAILASINGTLLGGARVAAALAEQGGLPAALARVDARGTPLVALGAVAAASTALVLVGGFDTLVTATGLAMTVAGCLTAVSALLLRRDGPAPFRAPTWAPVLYLAAGVLVAVDALRTGALSGLALVVLPALGALVWSRSTHR